MLSEVKILNTLNKLIKQYEQLQQQIKKNSNNLEKISELAVKLNEIKKELEETVKLLVEDEDALKRAVLENRELLLKLSTALSDKELKKKIDKELYNTEIDYTFTIRTVIAVGSEQGVKVLTEDDFNFDEDADSIIDDIIQKDMYVCSVITKAGTVIVRPAEKNYDELAQLDYSTLEGDAFAKYSTTTVKFDLNGFPAFKLSELARNMTKYLNKPVKVKATLISLSTSPVNILFRYKVKERDEESVEYNFPPQMKLQNKRVNRDSEHEIPVSYIFFEIADEHNTTLKCITRSENLEKLRENLGAELEFWGLIYTLNSSNKELKSEYIFYVSDIKTAEEEQATLSEQQKREVEQFLKQFKSGEELLNWLIDNYAPRIRYKKRGDFVWRMKLTHLILAQNSWLNNEQMLHALLLSRPGLGKTTLALYYLPAIAKRVKYADRSRLSIPGLLGGFDPATKENRVGVLKSADRGVMVIDEIDKFTNAEKSIVVALNTVMQNGIVSITLANSSRSIQYKTRPNMLLLGNYSTEELEKMLEYADTTTDIEKTKEEFISREIMKITQHMSSLDRFIILDSDIFEAEEETEEQLEKKIEEILDTLEETESLEPTISEINKLNLIRKVLIYNALHMDKKKLNESIKKHLKLITTFVANQKIKQEKKRTIYNLIHLIKVIAILKGEQEVSRDTVELALMLAGISARYKRIWASKEEKLRNFVEEFMQKQIEELGPDGITLTQLKRKFNQEIITYNEVEQRELKKQLNEVIHRFETENIIKVENDKIKLTEKFVADKLSDFAMHIQEYSTKIVPISNGDFTAYIDTKKATEKLRISTELLLFGLKLIDKNNTVKRTTISKNGKVRTVYVVEVDKNKIEAIMNKQLPLLL